MYSPSQRWRQCCSVPRRVVERGGCWTGNKPEPAEVGVQYNYGVVKIKLWITS